MAHGTNTLANGEIICLIQKFICVGGKCL